MATTIIAENPLPTREQLKAKLSRAREQLWRLASVVRLIRDSDGNEGCSNAGNAADLVQVELSLLADKILEPDYFLEPERGEASECLYCAGTGRMDI